MGRKRKSGEGTVRLRKDGRWEGRVVIGYDDKGLPKTKNVLAKTKAECVEKLNTLKSTVTPMTAVKVRADMPFGEWAEFWYENYSKPMLRPSSQRSYEGFIRLYIRPKLGEIPLNKLTTNDLQQFYTWMKKDGRDRNRESKGAGFSDNMLQNCHSLCRRALEKAVAEGLIPQNPALGCKLTPGQRKEMQVLSREEMQRLLIQARAEGYYEVFLLELTTGLRVGELMALQWDDLNFNTGELRIERQVCKVKGELLICYTGSVSSRYVTGYTVTADYQRLLRSLYESLADGLIDQSEYQNLKKSYTNRRAQAEEQADAIRLEMEQEINHSDQGLGWIEEFRRYQNIEVLDRSIVVRLIERVLIFRDRRVDIVYRWQNEFQWQTELLLRAQGQLPGREAV